MHCMMIPVKICIVCKYFFSRDLRKRQARRVSEDGGHDEERGGRHGKEESGGGGGATDRELRRGGRRMRSESQSELDTPVEKPK